MATTAAWSALTPAQVVPSDSSYANPFLDDPVIKEDSGLKESCVNTGQDNTTDKKNKRKQQRRRRQEAVGAGAVAGVAGLVVVGPIVAAAAATGAAVAVATSKGKTARNVAATSKDKKARNVARATGEATVKAGKLAGKGIHMTSKGVAKGYGWVSKNLQKKGPLSSNEEKSLHSFHGGTGDDWTV